MSRRVVNLREWWVLRRDQWAGENRPVSLAALVQARKLHSADFPKPAYITPPNTAYYYLTELDGWKRQHPGLFRTGRTQDRSGNPPADSKETS